MPQLAIIHVLVSCRMFLGTYGAVVNLVLGRPCTIWRRFYECRPATCSSRNKRTPSTVHSEREAVDYIEISQNRYFCVRCSFLGPEKSPVCDHRTMKSRRVVEIEVRLEIVGSAFAARARSNSVRCLLVYFYDYVSSLARMKWG
jgi:hypothetical protein